MEQQQRSLFFTAAVGLIILAIIVGSIYYLVKFIQTRVSSSRQSPQASVEAIVEASASPVIENIQGEQVVPQNTIQSVQGSIQSGASTARPAPSLTPAPTPETKGGVTIAGDRKIFSWGNIQMSYPKSWGLVTCTNSKNVELDPNNPADTKIACSTALKPITVLVDDFAKCDGENVKIGNTEVIKSRKVDGGYTAYLWCTKTVPILNITHRVSSGNDPASSKEDYSKQVEEMISRLTFTRS